MSGQDLLPDDEEQRLEAVRRYNVLDTPPDGAFDRITSLAARICDVPISTISIVDHDRIWFKSAHGIDVDEIGRDPGLCASAVLRAEPHVVTNAEIDPRTLTNPLVCGELGLRFYVGIPLTTADGYNLGTLNIIDVEPRAVTDDEIAVLLDLAAIVIDELEMRITAREAVRSNAEREAARFRDRILAGVSHEMRTPLAMILGLLDLSDEGNEGTGALRRQVTHLERLVKQFLDFTSIEDDQLPELDRGPVDVGRIAADVGESFADLASVAVDVDPQAPVAYGNVDRVRQVLLELVSNAVRFSPEEAPVSVRVSAGEDGTAVQVEVEDEGRGIAVDDIERIFEASNRAPDSTGTGIGLYVARALAESQAGSIDVRSVPGEGSVFTFVLPAASAASRQD